VLSLAILLFGAGGPLLRSSSDDQRLGYLLMAVVAGVAIGAGMLVSASVAPRDVPLMRLAPRPCQSRWLRSSL
jgi:GPH family glycoside/pentoside/hexuronide:cation symporter